MSKPVFYDPQRKRWPRLRRLLDVTGITITLLVLFFIVSFFVRSGPVSHLLMPEQKLHLRALKERETRKKPKTKGTHRKTATPPSEVVLNADEGIRAAYYVTWDAGSFVCRPSCNGLPDASRAFMWRHSGCEHRG